MENEKILKAVHQIFHNSPARREDYFTITGSNQFCLSFCATRLAIFSMVYLLFTLPEFCALENNLIK